MYVSINPVAEAGHPPHVKGVFCRFLYGSEWNSASIMEVYADGCCALKSLSGSVIYEVPKDRIMPALPEGLEGYKPDLECRASVDQKRQNAKVVHVFPNKTCALVIACVSPFQPCSSHRSGSLIGLLVSFCHFTTST